MARGGAAQRQARAAPDVGAGALLQGVQSYGQAAPGGAQRAARLREGYYPVNILTLFRLLGSLRAQQCVSREASPTLVAALPACPKRSRGQQALCR